MKGKKEEKLILEATVREVFGKKLRKLRYTGVIPANIFGPEYKSTAVSVNTKDFLKVYRIAKETGIVFIKLGQEEVPTLIKTVQKHPVTDLILHIDLRKINLSQKITTEVPVKVVGSSEAVSQKAGVLLTQMNKLLVEALPQDIPQFIEVDITTIKDIGQEIKVADLKKSEKYQVKDETNKVVVSVVAHKEESITPETAVAAPEVITEKKTTEGEAVVETGQAPAAETAKKVETKTTEQKQSTAKQTAPVPKK